MNQMLQEPEVQSQTTEASHVPDVPELPPAPMAGGSNITASLGNAVVAACEQVRARLAEAAGEADFATLRLRIERVRKAAREAFEKALPIRRDG